MQRGRTGDQGNVARRETRVCQAPRVVFDSGEKPRVCGFSVHAAAMQGLDERFLDLGYAAVAAALRDKAAAGFQGAMDAGDSLIWVAHPVECGVAEHRVELALESQMLAVHDLGFDAELSGSLDLRRAGIDARNGTSHFYELRRQGSIAAAEIEDA